MFFLIFYFIVFNKSIDLKSFWLLYIFDNTDISYVVTASISEV